MVARQEREHQQGHRATVLWFTGLSGSGKSTIAIALERSLFQQGFRVQMLDGDNIRSGLCNNLGFSIEDRQENVRRIAEVARLFLDSGTVCLCSFITPTHEGQQMVQEIVGQEDCRIVFVDTPLEVCEQRDVKGLYQKARAGEIKGFTGIDSPYEAPQNPFLQLKTVDKTVQECVAEIEQHLLPLLQLK